MTVTTTDPALWLRDVLRERAEVRSAEFEKAGVLHSFIVRMMDGSRLLVTVVHAANIP